MKRILYVEDNVDTADAVKAILSNHGFDVQTADCGKKGIDLAKNGFDLYLLDIMLPDMSGWDIYEKLKGNKQAKFAFLSAIPVSPERMQELKSEGVSDYIMKPFDKKDLINRINLILGPQAK
jgi:two-component system response regulator VicR